MNIYKNITALIGLLAVIYLIWGCERDDICGDDAQTTPLLIIKFFDDEMNSEIKPPIELQIKAAGIDEIFPLPDNLDSISIPLRTDVQVTDFEFTINTTEDDIEPNTDKISFQYRPVEEYVSSACGFRVRYEGITQSLTNEEGNENWIKNISIQRNNITDEATAHIFIFH